MRLEVRSLLLCGALAVNLVNCKSKFYFFKGQNCQKSSVHMLITFIISIDIEKKKDTNHGVFPKLDIVLLSHRSLSLSYESFIFVCGVIYICACLFASVQIEPLLAFHCR